MLEAFRCQRQAFSMTHEPAPRPARQDDANLVQGHGEALSKTRRLLLPSPRGKCTEKFVRFTSLQDPSPRLDSQAARCAQKAR